VHVGPRRRSSTSVDEAQGIAIEALAWLSANPIRLERFLAIFGLGPQNLRQAAAQPGFLAAVLDHLAAHEQLLIDFATATGRAPERIAEARERLNVEEPEADP